MTANTTIYTKHHCPNCDSTKKLFKKLDIEYTEINIEDNPEVLPFLKAEGFLAAPVIMTDSDSWSGFNEAKIRNLADAAPADDDVWDF